MLAGPAAMVSRVKRPRTDSRSYWTSRGARQSGQPDRGLLPKLLPHSLQRSSYFVQEDTSDRLRWAKGDGPGSRSLVWGSRYGGSWRSGSDTGLRPPNLMYPVACAIQERVDTGTVVCPVVVAS